VANYSNYQAKEIKKVKKAKNQINYAKHILRVYLFTYVTEEKGHDKGIICAY
jgi:hypothetical protein